MGQVKSQAHFRIEWARQGSSSVVPVQSSPLSKNNVNFNSTNLHACQLRSRAHPTNRRHHHHQHLTKWQLRKYPSRRLPPSPSPPPKSLPKMPSSNPVLRGAVTDAMDTDPPPSPTPPPSSPIQSLPIDALHKIFSLLPLRQALLCRSVCRSFNESLISPPPLPTLNLLALRNSHRHSYPHPPDQLTAFDPNLDKYLNFPLSFLDFTSLSPITSCNSLLYLWADSIAAGSNPDQKNPKSLIVCNPLTRSFKVLPQLGSAWSRHGTVLVGPGGVVLVLTELAALYYSPVAKGSSSWMKYSLNLPSKPRSPVLIGDSIFTLCDVGSPWRSQWKLFCCRVEELKGGRGWVQVERSEWGDVFDVLKRPRLVRGGEKDEVLMVGGLRSSFAVDSPCSTVLILRLSLERMEWDEAGRMPTEMYRCFASGGGGGGTGNNKVKVFGGEGRVWFSGKRVKGKMAMWEEEGGEEEEEEGELGGKWRWVEGVLGYGEGVYRGFVFNAGLTEIP